MRLAKGPAHMIRAISGLILSYGSSVDFCIVVVFQSNNLEILWQQR